MRQSGSDNNRIVYAEDPRMSLFRIGAVSRAPDRNFVAEEGRSIAATISRGAEDDPNQPPLSCPGQLQALMRWSRSKTNATWQMLGFCDQTTTRMAREGNPVAARMASE